MTSPYNPTDLFNWKGINVYQDEHVLKVGTDALLLGTWIPALNIDPKSILDVGTGSGILALLMANAFPSASVFAIDPDEHAVKLALYNAGKSDFINKIRIEQSGVMEYAEITKKKFDLILSNPPFYLNHILPESASMKTAKHASASPATWMSAMSDLVNDHGFISLILPSALTFEWIREGNAHHMYCNNRMDFFSFPGDHLSKRSLLCFSRVLAKPQHKKMIMYEREKKYTADYAAWIGNR